MTEGFRTQFPGSRHTWTQEMYLVSLVPACQVCAVSPRATFPNRRATVSLELSPLLWTPETVLVLVPAPGAGWPNSLRPSGNLGLSSARELCLARLQASCGELDERAGGSELTVGDNTEGSVQRPRPCEELDMLLQLGYPDTLPSSALPILGDKN